MHLFKVSLDKVLKAEKAEVELKIYEFTNSIQHSEAMLAYYETRLSTLSAQLAQRADKKQEELPPKQP